MKLRPWDTNVGENGVLIFFAEQNPSLWNQRTIRSRHFVTVTRANVVVRIQLQCINTVTFIRHGRIRQDPRRASLLLLGSSLATVQYCVRWQLLFSLHITTYHPFLRCPSRWLPHAPSIVREYEKFRFLNSIFNTDGLLIFVGVVWKTVFYVEFTGFFFFFLTHVHKILSLRQFVFTKLITCVQTEINFDGRVWVFIAVSENILSKRVKKYIKV